jgi:hypothetical protein
LLRIHAQRANENNRSAFFPEMRFIGPALASSGWSASSSASSASRSAARRQPGTSAPSSSSRLGLSSSNPSSGPRPRSAGWPHATQTKVPVARRPFATWSSLCDTQCADRDSISRNLPGSIHRSSHGLIADLNFAVAALRSDLSGEKAEGNPFCKPLNNRTDLTKVRPRRPWKQPRRVTMPQSADEI